MSSWERAPPLQADGSLRIAGPELELSPMPTRGTLVLCVRGDTEAVAKVVSRRLGFELPKQPNRSAQGAETALWLCPGRWLIVCDLASVSTLTAQLERALEGSIHLIADVTDARTAFEISGSRAPEVLAKLCAIDLHPSAFRPGNCARTLLVRIPMLLYRPGEALRYELLVDRSLAHYTWDWLSDAACEFVERGTAG